MDQVDFSPPLATLLRESTYEAHETVAKSPGATALLSGQLARDEYVTYLMMLWHIYDTLEDALDKHAAHPVLEPTYNPSLLRRAPALADDISHLLQVPLANWQSHPVHADLQSALPAPLTAYLTRIRALADSPDPTPLLAHSYVRYLGDLSGGQTVRRTIAKAYELDEADGLGLKFYEFRELMGTGIANQGEMKRIKEWFRNGMNTAGDIGLVVKSAVYEESNLAFDLNTELFTTIRLPEANSRSRLKGIDNTGIKQEIIRAGEQMIQSQSASRQQRKTYLVSQVLPVIIAVGLAHFILVTGGFTGERGYQKLLAVQQWFTGAAPDSL